VREGVETIFRVGGEELICLSILSNYGRNLCFIYPRKTEVPRRNHRESTLKIDQLLLYMNRSLIVEIYVEIYGLYIA
jgi:hypothetical protein